MLDSGVRTIYLVQVVCLPKRGSVLILEYVVIRLNKVEEHICFQHHLERTICAVVVLPHLAIHLETVVRDCSKLKIDLRHERVIVARLKQIAGWMDVNEPPNYPGLGITDSDRLVSTHDEKRVDPRCVARLVLLINRHVLVRHDRVDFGIVLNSGQIAVVLHSHQRVVSESLCGKYVVVPHKCFGLEGCGVPFEQLEDDVDDGSLAGAGGAVEHQEFLNLLGVTGYDRSDSPFDLGPLLRIVEVTDQLVPGRMLPWRQSVRKPARDVVCLPRLGVCERKHFIELVAIVAYVA